MGLRGFSLPLTGAAETRTLPEWSTQHFVATGRPLRIAIDQANWWHRNITVQKEAEIKTKSPGSHLREKRIMERIFYLLRMNIQLLFVFDGPKKPSRRRPTEDSYSESNIRLLKELLDQLGVPRHDAPSESAAECVRLQELGIVDAIWTDNTDAFMFGGSPTMVQFHHKKPEGDQFKNSSTVVIYSADRIKERTGLTRKWFLMYATLVGCDYADGLDGLDSNPTKFFRIAQHGCFQAAANLLAASVETPLVLSKWRHVVTNIVRRTFPEEEFTAPPKTFPDLNILESCAHPIVSADSVLRDLPCLRDGWFRPYGPDMLSRYRFLLFNFNTQIHESWIARDLVPIELNHRLRSSSSIPSSSQLRKYGIQTKPKHKDRPDSTITVDPLKVLPELLSAFPKEMYRVVNGSRVKIEPPVFRPEEMELLDCVLRRGLAEGDLPKYVAKPKPRDTRDSSATINTTTTSSSSSSSTPTSATKKKKPPIPPPKNVENNRKNTQPTSRLARRIPHVPPINTHLPLPLHNIDTSVSPTCIHFHDGLTLPGELDWHHTPTPVTSPLPVSRRASFLAGKLSGGQFDRKTSIAMGSPLPLLKQPAWDDSAVVVDLTDSD
ncbi:PIN domain-like protein [Xylariaceae sp. AK1471]|nr:PIN domain-like protein [Xylariaceae sp. AK1471]